MHTYMNRSYLFICCCCSISSCLWFHWLSLFVNWFKTRTNQNAKKATDDSLICIDVLRLAQTRTQATLSHKQFKMIDRMLSWKQKKSARAVKRETWLCASGQSKEWERVDDSVNELLANRHCHHLSSAQLGSTAHTHTLRSSAQYTIQLLSGRWGYILAHFAFIKCVYIHVYMHNSNRLETINAKHTFMHVPRAIYTKMIAISKQIGRQTFKSRARTAHINIHTELFVFVITKHTIATTTQSRKWVLHGVYMHNVVCIESTTLTRNG